MKPSDLVRALLPLTAFTLLLAPRLEAQLTGGNLAVVRVGDGTAPLSSAATAVFLDEYTPSGTLVQTLPLPTAASGANKRLTNSGVATSEAFLTLSSNGQYLLAGGYDAQVGTLSVATTTSVANPRVVARIDLNGIVDTSTALSDAYSGGNIRSVASSDGVLLWTGGTASGAAGGVRFATITATTSTQLSTTTTNTRVVGIAGSQLYVTSASGALQGVSTVGTGLPTSSGQTITALAGFPTTTGPSAYDFYFADANTLYVADDRVAPSGGIQKWTQGGGVWTLQYTLTPPSNVGCRGLSGYVNGGLATLYATTAVASVNQIVSVTDVGPSSTFTTVAASATDTVFRGIRFVPVRGATARLPHGCGTTTIDVTGQTRPGGIVATNIGNVAGQAFIGLGVNVLGLKFCSCTIGHDWLLSVPGKTLSLTVPNSPSLIGGKVAIQGVDLGGAGGCAFPQFAATDTIVVTIG